MLRNLKMTFNYLTYILQFACKIQIKMLIYNTYEQNIKVFTGQVSTNN